MYDAADDSRKSYDLAISEKRKELLLSSAVQIGDATLYNADCFEVLPTLGEVDAVVTDPPYGILAESGSAATRRPGYNQDNGVCLWDKAVSIGQITAVLDAANKSMLWGGCHMPLPPTFGYLIWDKMCEGLNFGEVEYCWTTERFAPRMLRVRAAGADGGKQHPTQKPTRVMEWCLGFIPDAETILDPFMGSGTTGVACAKLGRKFIGIELEPKYFDIACKRIEDAYKQPDMFVAPPAKPVQSDMALSQPEGANG